MLGFSVAPFAPVAKLEKSAYLMAPIRVDAPPFGQWGIGLHLRHRLNNRPYQVDLVLRPRKPAPFQTDFWGVQVIGGEGIPATLRHGHGLQRRMAGVVWGRQTIVISKEADGGVSLTESGRRRSVPAGSVLMLRADGRFEIADRPPPPRR